jgi:Xaa-Pro dipeptidase
MAVHFAEVELAARRRRLLLALAEGQLDGMLLFAQESMYWLTGYDTFGFCFFQCLYVDRDGRTSLLTRSADLRQAQHTSNVAEIRVWKDGAAAKPAADLAAMLLDLGARGARLGVEFDSYGLTYANGRRLAGALDGVVDMVDASGLIDALRVTKSAAEIGFVRAAAALSDRADRTAVDMAQAGADEGAILAAMQGAIFAGDGDYPANEFIIGSGPDALLCRYKSGRRRLGADDQVTLEFAGVYRHYHAAIMRTIVIGEPSPLHLSYHAAAEEALLACEAELRPGRTAGDVYHAHARVLAKRGLNAHRLNACGYSLGARFSPSWMDSPMFYEGNEFVIAANQVFFAHMIIMDSATGTAVTLGRTYLLGENGAAALNLPKLDLIAK